jgi:P4 family phage/plasmid primase-like protien
MFIPINIIQKTKMPPTVSICCSKYAKLKGTDTDIRKIPVKQLIEILKGGQIPVVYELIPHGIPIKPFFDIDIKSSSVDNFEELYETRDTILKEHLDYLSKEFEGAEFAISSSHRLDKISYHITIPNYRTEMIDMYNYSRDFTNAFDPAVYHDSPDSCPRKFRTIYSRGEVCKVKLTPESHKDTLEDHLITVVRGSAKEFIKDSPTPIDPAYAQPRRGGDIDPNIQTLGDVMIQNDRVDYKEWTKIGVSMLIVYDEEKAYNEFLKYTKRHKGKFDLASFNKNFEDLSKRQYKRGGWGILKKWTPKEHWDLIEKVNIPMESYDYDIANYIFKTFTKYTITTTKSNNRSQGSSKGIWFRYLNHRWQETCDVEIRNDMITDFLYGKYEEAIQDAQKVLAQTPLDDEEAKTRAKGYLKDLKKVYGEIKSVSKISKIAEALFHRYYSRDFQARLNQNPHLLGFTNGVYDFRTKEFRVGYEDDYISLHTGYDFKVDRDYRTEQLLRKILLEICCEREDLCDTLINLLARSLIGDNSTNNQLFYCFYGRGSNGKSTIGSILKEALGEYHAVCPTSLLSQKSQRSDACNADVAKLIGKRFVVCSETEQDVPINISTLKNMSGEEFISYRSLYESVKESRITWSIFLLTNDKVKLPSNDYGTTRRFRYIPFNGRFLDPDELEGKENTDTVKYYKKDRDIMKTENLRTIRADFMNLLIHANPPDRIEFPQWMLKETAEHIRSQDRLTGLLDYYFTEGSSEYGLSWADFKRILRDDTQFRQLKYNSDQALLEQVMDRLTYAKEIKTSNPVRFISTHPDGSETKTRSRWYINHLKVKVQEEDEEEEEYDCIL